MFLRTPIQPQPENQPQPRQHRRDGEDPAPAVVRGDDGDENRRNRRPHRAADAVKPDGDAAFGGRKPFAHRLGRRRETARLTQPQHEPENRKRLHRLREAGERVGDGPPRHKNRETHAHAQLVHHATGQQIGDGVSDEKKIDDIRILVVADGEVFLNRRREQTEHTAINVVQHRRQKEGEGNPPAQIWNFESHQLGRKIKLYQSLWIGSRRHPRQNLNTVGAYGSNFQANEPARFSEPPVLFAMRSRRVILSRCGEPQVIATKFVVFARLAKNSLAGNS